MRYHNCPATWLTRLGGARTHARAALRSYSLGGWWGLACLLWFALASTGAHAQGSTLLPGASLGTITTQVSAGERHTCAVTTGGAVRCWGYNNFGESTVPSALQSGAAYASAADGHTCAVTT